MSTKLLLAPAFVFVVLSSLASAQGHEGLDVQDARNRHIEARGHQTFYPADHFDLSGLPAYKPETKVSGIIRIWGNNYIQTGRLAEYWEAEFKKFHPDVTFDLHLTTHLTALAGLYTRVADLGMARKVRFGELEAYQRTLKRDPLEVSAVTGSYNVPGWSPALPVIVNKNNPISHLTIKQLDGIFGAQRDGAWEGTTWHPERGRSASDNIRTWGQLGLTGEWKDKSIHVWGYNLRYDTTYYWDEMVFHGGNKWNESFHEATNFVNPDGTLNLEGSQINDAVAEDPYAIGFTVGAPLTPKIKFLALASRSEEKYIALSLDTVHDRTYPLYEEIFFYANRDTSGAIDPKVKEFLLFVLSRDGQEQVVKDGKYLPLTPEVVDANRKKLN